MREFFGSCLLGFGILGAAILVGPWLFNFVVWYNKVVNSIFL